MEQEQINIIELDSIGIEQRVSDGKYNATKIMKDWETKGNPKVRLDNFFRLSELPDIMQEIVKDEKIITRNDLPIPSETYNKYLKSLLVESKTGKGNCTWMHPVLAVKFLMWIDVNLKYEVIKNFYKIKFEPDMNNKGFVEFGEHVLKRQ